MKYLWPPLVLLLAAGITALLVMARRPPDTVDPEPFLPIVEFVRAQPEDITLRIRSQGPVAPRTETELTPEVGGRILRVAPAFEDGAFFQADDLLLELDPVPLEVALGEARATLAAARLALAQEIAQSEQARADWEELGAGEPGPLVLRLPQQEKARADVEAAEKRLLLAERNLERAHVRAPYAGRTRERRVDVGQVVTANATTLGRIFATDAAEIRLPLTLREAALLDLPPPATPPDGKGPRVRFRDRSDPSGAVWNGTVVRTEAAIDPRTRLLSVVARIEDPFGRTRSADSPPLEPGRFLEAEIEGVRLPSAYRIPRSALTGESNVRIIDGHDRVETRTVTIRHRTATDLIITDGLEAGERVVISAIEFFVENMSVRPTERGTAGTAEELP
ncbi:MAG: efflux RND transporter periplasmic adaptor subunit [Opitutales bacterium]|nr:efflux RND transporter periplasmic adaptor subunit [Opitutales bacterium]